MDRPAEGRAGSGPRPGRLAVVCCLAFAVYRIWCCLCSFPTQEWNDVRLRAAFLIVDGLPLYPGLDAGPITTWIYGPVMPLLMLPATLAPTIDSAMLLAGAMNACLLVGAITFACLRWPQPADRPLPLALRLGALGVSLLLLPQNFFIFLQADNASLACGLVSLTCLARARVWDKPHWWWLAAGFAGATAFSKLHGVTLLAAEIGWVWFAGSRPKALQYGLKLILVCAGLLLVTLWVSAAPGAAWEMMITIPSRLPFTSAWSRHLSYLTPFYALMVGLPGLLAFHANWRHRLLASGLGLPVIVWLASLPLGIAGSLGAGGGYNSLHGAFYLIPLALVNLGSHRLGRSQPSRLFSLGVWLTGPAALLVFDQVNILQLPKSPDASLLVEAVAISARRGDQVWMPWHPLATRFATGRHDHDEDGLYVRQVTALFPRRRHVVSCLPPRWDSTLLQLDGMNWMVAWAMREPGATAQPHGSWVLISRHGPDSGLPDDHRARGLARP